MRMRTLGGGSFKWILSLLSGYSPRWIKLLLVACDPQGKDGVILGDGRQGGCRCGFDEAASIVDSGVML